MAQHVKMTVIDECGMVHVSDSSANVRYGIYVEMHEAITAVLAAVSRLRDVSQGYVEFEAGMTRREHGLAAREEALWEMRKASAKHFKKARQEVQRLAERLEGDLDPDTRTPSGG